MTARKVAASKRPPLGTADGCVTCGQPHVHPKTGRATCGRHVSGGYSRPEIAGRCCIAPPMHGQKVCKNHGGKSPQAKAKAAEVIAEQQATKVLHAFGERVDVDPAEELLDLICHTAGYVRFIRTQVDVLDRAAMTWGVTKNKIGGDDAGETSEAKPNIWIQMLDHWTEKLAKLIVEALKLNLDERRVRLAERQGEALMKVLDGVLAELGHDPANPETARVVARQLRLVEGL